MTEPLPRAWTVRIPQPAPWLTANIDRHKYRRAALVKAWRKATVGGCWAMRLPHGITPVEIFARICYTSARPPVRDRLNLAPTLKAVVDALTPPRTFTRNGTTYRTHGYGLLPDDSDRHVISTDWRLARDRWDGIELVITPAPHTVEQRSLFDLPT